jgi:ABC-type polysaccharide/polyol phosphate transport system ATPase subunit
MAEPGIVFDQVWKKFKRGEMHDSLRDLIPAVTRRLLSRTPPSDALQQREFWALRDVGFEVRPGEALGIIGANGAGKSTTLKILNRILRPTRGHVEVRGRAGALIEISAGFHQDLTGRENVFLQGAIMGMSKGEIIRKFDEIVDFAGIAEFIDTPVKRYSSGMNARLGFAIAAHLDPDVLIIDEVLSVGDLSFQNRAFGRIQDLVRSGIPVVIVSHQLDRVAALCTKGILLSRGTVAHEGTAGECIAKYVMSTEQHAGVADASAPARIDEVRLLDELPVVSGGRLRYLVRGHVRADVEPRFDPFHVRVRSTDMGQVIFETSGQNCGLSWPGPGDFECEVELQINAPPGIYTLETAVFDGRLVYETSTGPALHLQVVEGAVFSGHVQMNARMRLAGGNTASARRNGERAVAVLP